MCIMWFPLEYILRLTGAPRKCAFLKDFMNIVDLLAILPFFITIVVLEATPEGEDQQEIQNIRQTISVFRIMRVLRIFKLARHSTGLKSIAYTLTNSYKELGLLVLFMSLGVLVFASLIFFAEKDEEDTSFTSIPISFWWAVITMTTVGNIHINIHFFSRASLVLVLFASLLVRHSLSFCRVWGSNLFLYFLTNLTMES